MIMSAQLKKVLILDGVDSVCADKLKQAGIDVTTRSTKLTKDELAKEINNYDALIVRSVTKVTADVLQTSTRLKVVGRAGTGVDNIDVEAATRKGVLVMNTPGGNTLSAAEHTCGLICALSRSLPQACATLKAGAWDRKKFIGNELSGKVLAIIGIGRIGKEVCERMRAFGMKVVGYDPIVSAATAAKWGIDFRPLDQIWPVADYVTVHTPLLPQTKYLINEQVFGRCKPTVKVVNVARGGIIEEKALLKALDEGTCAGAALDVFEEEPPKDLRLVQHPKVICTPHLGANTHEAQERVAVEIAEQLVAMSEGRKLVGVVNADALADAGSEGARPWIALASCLGAVASKLLGPERGIRLTVQLHGDEIGNLWKLMAPSILKGFLQTMTKEVNLVNSSTLARESEIEISVTNGAAEAADASCCVSHTDCVDLLIHKGDTKIRLVGSVDGTNPSLLRINESFFPFGLVMDNNLLFFKTEAAEPNRVVGSVAAVLNEAPLSAILTSSGADAKETWIVARTQKHVDGIPILADAKFVAQIIF